MVYLCKYIYKWIKDFLSGRKQKVIINGKTLRGCQLSKTNTCIIFTCIKKNDNFSKETGHS